MTVTIKLRDGGVESVPGHAVRGTPFAVHRLRDAYGELLRAWRIMHVRSGCALSFAFPSETEAIAAARAAAAAVDWGFDDPATVRTWGREPAGEPRACDRSGVAGGARAVLPVPRFPGALVIRRRGHAVSARDHSLKRKEATMTTTRLSAPESSKLLKRALAKAFPGVRFSVRLDRGTAYGCADVSWTDGPLTAEVDRVCSPFEGEGYDGMTDSTIHKETDVGDGRRSGLRLILCKRRESPEAMAKARAELAAAGYTTGREVDLNCAARMICRGEPMVRAVDFFRLKRAEVVR